MNYTLITSRGRVYTFYVKALAETYQRAYGGVIVSDAILVDNVAQKAV
jgi:hypothetical protein